MYQMQTVRKMVIGPGNVQKTSKTRKQTEARKTESRKERSTATAQGSEHF